MRSFGCLLLICGVGEISPRSGGAGGFDGFIYIPAQYCKSSLTSGLSVPSVRVTTLLVDLPKAAVRPTIEQRHDPLAMLSLVGHNMDWH